MQMSQKRKLGMQNFKKHNMVTSTITSQENASIWHSLPFFYDTCFCMEQEKQAILPKQKMQQSKNRQNVKCNKTYLNAGAMALPSRNNLNRSKWSLNPK